MIPVAEVVIRGNLNPRSTVRARHGMSDRAFVIAGRGAADWHGGADLFLQLAALLQRRFSGRKALQFVWIGHLSSDDSSRILRRDCVRLGLSGIAQFVGDQENPHELLHACDLFCLPSREDPFQVEMLEVGALSIPFVCFDSPGGAKDFAARGAGFTVPYLDVPAMVEKCAQLIEDEPLRQRTGMAVGNFVREDFDVEVLAPRVEALLNSLLPALASCARRVDSLHKEGGTLMESEDRTRALTWMRPLLELAPDDLEWVRVLSKVCCQLGDLGGTAQQFDRDTTLATQRPTRHALQDSSQMQQQRYSEAEAAARRALELAPLDLDMLRLLAPLAHQEERYAEACGCYATITRLAPRDVEARVSRAACSAAQGHRVLAELVLEEALDLQPDHPEALALLAQLSSNPQALVAIDYDILVPIFNAPDDVRRCVESLLRHTKPRHTIYLLNDASPDPRIAPLLHEFAAKHAHIKVVTAIQNGGFVTNMNVGFGLSRRDVVILNSDTEVTADWLQRMDRCRRSNDKIGIVSPLSNNATILSVPVMNTRNALPDGMTPDEFASLVVANSQRAYPRIPTAVGFCMLITRATLDAVGLFDAAFGLGYGEECDLCMRAWAAGIESVCCDDAYVQHNGEASFGSVQGIGERKQRNAELLSFRWPNYSKAVYRYCQQNPLRQLQERLQKVLRPTTGSQGPNVLQVIHSYNLPGGTELHTQDVVDRLVKRFRQTVVFPGQIPAWTDFAEASSKSVARVVVFNRGNVAPTHRYLGQPGDLRSALVEESFSQFIAGGDYDIVHFQHLAGWGSLRLPRIAKEQGKRCVLSVHDYFMLCPEYILINSDGKRCPKNRAGAADEDCLRCLQTKRVVVQAGAPELADYLALRESLTREVMEVMDAVVVPSAFVREKLLAAFGNQFADRIRVIPHGITVLRRSRPACRKRGVLRVGVLGSLNIQKGLQMVIEAAALLKSSSVRLEVLGHVPPAAEDALSRVSVKRHGGYRREDLPELLREIDLVLIPSLFDETFCLTLSEAQALGRPVLASAVGAIPERIVDGETGFLFSPATGQALAARLRELCAAPDLIAAVAERVLQLDIKTMDQNAQDYAELYQMLLQAPPRSIAEEKAHIVALPGPQWSWREQDFTSRVAETSLTSIIILAHNQLVHTRCCLESIAAHTSERHEIILVDNGSTDGTVAWAREYAQARTNVRLIENRSNRGFAAGNNQGVAIASGDFIVLLNNDTVATPGWLRNMLKVVREHPKTGVVGPRSNWVYGRQKVDEVGYKSLEELPAFATAWAAQHAGQSRVANRVVGFCLLARREVIEAVGGLDEQFGSGNFEDDDFCVRAHLAGFETRIADDSFVHHVGNATFTGAGIDYGKAMQTNWSLFKSKWAIPSETPPFPGYLTPDVAPPGVALKVSLPDLRLTHRISADGRCWMDKLVAAAAEAKPIALPPCALVGQLREARQFLQQKKLPAAWGATRAVLKHRPFHPEAYLLLAEIALEAQDSAAAQACAQFARQIAPEFRPAKKFLKGKLHGHLKPEWLVLPEEIGKHKAESRNWLSVCLIVKNEERFLGQCLTSVKGLAHQIVVVDTGSTDRTVEIAREHGAHVHPFAWCDDFSAARNAALEHATGDWVLMLDADEELPPEQHAALRKLLHTPSVISWRLPLQDVGREAEGCSYVPRLFRNAPGLYYAGRVHEQVFTSIEERRQEWGLDTRLGDATLRHHGYTKELTLERDKVGRNLRLLEQAVLETPGDTNLLMNYGLELTRSGRQEEGLRQYRAAFDTMAGRPSAQVVPEMREMLLSQFCTQLMAAKRHAKIVQVLTSPLARAGSGLTASLHFTLGLAQTELKDFAAAAEQFRQCLAKRDRPALTPVNVEIRKAGPRHCLALCLEQMGEIGAADEEFRRAIEAEPQARPLRRDYARFLAAHERQADALNLLFALANEKPTDSQVWQQGGQLALTRPEFLEVAVDWTAGAAEHLPDDPALVQQRAEALMLAGQCGAALPLWRRWPPASNQALAAALVLCETAVGENQFSLEAADEAAVSREFVKWYQKLLQFNARQTVESLNAKLEVLERTLPSAASILASALAEAAETVGV